MLGKITVLLIFLLLVWGNIVAGLKVGLACPDWPLCYGKILPPLRWDIYMEFMHRVIGAVASIFLIVLSYKRFRNYSGPTKIIPIITVFLLLSQIILGGIVVLLKLPVDITTLHFGIAIILFSLTIYLAFFDGKDKKPVFTLGNFSGLFFFLVLLMFIQVVLGAYVRHSDAGLACPDFPKCLGYWIPPQLSGIVLTHFVHRVIAYLIFFGVLSIYAFSFLNPRLKSYRSIIMAMILLIVLQIIVGIGIIHTKLFFLITALHISIALLLLGAILYTWFKEMKESYA